MDTLGHNAAIDLKKDFRHLYQPPKDRFVDVDVPELTYLLIDGHGDPNTSADYAEAVQALYTAAYASRAASRSRAGSAFVVGPLEGLWSSADPADFVAGNRSSWDWSMMIALPQQVSPEDLAKGLAAAAARKPTLPVAQVRPTRSRRVAACRSCTSAATTTRRRLWRDSTPRRCRSRA